MTNLFNAIRNQIVKSGRLNNQNSSSYFYKKLRYLLCLPGVNRQQPFVALIFIYPRGQKYLKMEAWSDGMLINHIECKNPNLACVGQRSFQVKRENLVTQYVKNWNFN